MDSRPNRVLLPDGKSSFHAHRSDHSGRHTQIAMNAIARKMDEIVANGKLHNWSPAQFRSELRSMMATERQGLKSGAIDLYVKLRPGVK